MDKGFPILIIFVLATTFVFVAGNKQNNCGVDHHCSPKKNYLARKFTNEKRHGTSARKVQLKYNEHRANEEIGSKRDNTLTDTLKNLLARVNKGTPKSVGPIAMPPAKVVASPTLKPAAIPANASKPNPAPISPRPPVVTSASSASPSSIGTSPATSGSEPTTATVTNSPTPTPATAVTSSANASCNATSGSCRPGAKPPVRPSGHNVTIAPGVVITSNGEIIFNPHFPQPIGTGQTSGGVPYPGVVPLPFPVSSPGAAQQPGTVISGMVPSVHPGTSGQQGPCINKFKHCIGWASKGECSSNAPFMIANCRRSCTNCAKCENEELQCEEWAKHGECGKNWRFMEQKCWKSCSNCAPCINTFPIKCIFWAKNGQCSLNRNFMEKLCWKSCSSCAKCENKHDGCVEWAANGHCSKTPTFMLPICWKSCSFCAPCVDKHPNKCPLWAEKGECKKNRKFMEENCWRSCSQCCKDKKKHCASWAKKGECTKNPQFMNENCAKSCNAC